MINILIGVVIGAVGFGLIIRNNPELAKKLGVIVDKIEDKIENKSTKAPAKKAVAKKQTAKTKK